MLTEREVRQRCNDCVWKAEAKETKHFCMDKNKPCNEVEHCEYEEDNK